MSRNGRSSPNRRGAAAVEFATQNLGLTDNNPAQRARWHKPERPKREPVLAKTLPSRKAARPVRINHVSVDWLPRKRGVVPPPR